MFRLVQQPRKAGQQVHLYLPIVEEKEKREEKMERRLKKKMKKKIESCKRR